MSSTFRWVLSAVAVLVACSAVSAAAQQAPPAARNSSPPTVKTPAGPEVPPDYVIGPDDVLTIVFWREKEMSGDQQVRPDGRITLPLINDIVAAGFTPEQLRLRLNEAAAQHLVDPMATVAVKEIRSRKVFVVGQIAKPGPYPLGGPTTVAQMLAVAGGPLEFAETKQISIIRNDQGKQVRLTFNYDDFKRGRNLQQNIELKPGDTIVIP